MGMHTRSRRGWLLVLTGMLLGPPIALGTTVNGTLQIGRKAVLLTPPFPGITLTFSGYDSSAPSYGSYSPTGLGGGITVITLYELAVNGTSNSTTFRITGFTSNPGVSYLLHLTCNGVTVAGGHATRTYDSSTGTVTYTWSSPDPLFGLSSLSVGTNVSCAVEHS